MRKRERIWVVSEVFYPDTDIATGYIATQIAKKFSEQYEVHVICGPEDYEHKNRITDENLETGIFIHRWKYFNLNKNHRIRRLLRVLGISFGLFIKGFNIGKHEKVFVISNPAFITPLYAFLKWIIPFKYVLLMHDVFPENLVIGNYIGENSFAYKLLNAIFIKCRRSADKIIVIGRDMKKLLLQNFPSWRAKDIIIIPNWADVESVYSKRFEENRIVKDLQLNDKIVIAFAGNHGVLQNLLEFVKIIERLSNPTLHFIFAGGGAEKSILEKYVKEKKLSNISFIPSFPRSENINILNACHIGLVSLSDRLYGVGVPSKSYNILAAEKPILFIGNVNTEIPEFLIDTDSGWVFNYNQVEDIIGFLNQISLKYLPEIMRKGKNGRMAVTDYCTKSKVLNDILLLIIDC